MDLQAILLLGLFIESSVQWFKKEYRHPWTYIALALGLGIAFATNLNLLVMAGLMDYSPLGIVGIVMFGMVLARGANFINDIFGKVAAK